MNKMKILFGATAFFASTLITFSHQFNLGVNEGFLLYKLFGIDRKTSLLIVFIATSMIFYSEIYNIIKFFLNLLCSFINKFPKFILVYSRSLLLLFLSLSFCAVIFLISNEYADKKLKEAKELAENCPDLQISGVTTCRPSSVLNGIIPTLPFRINTSNAS